MKPLIKIEIDEAPAREDRKFLERPIGYGVFGTLPDYPKGQTRYFLSKRLAPH